MKKIISIFLLVALCICSQTHAQSRADELMKQAQESLEKKEYIRARYLFLQAYNSFSTHDKYEKAVECGINASALYHRENYYKEAFELLRGAEQMVNNGEQKSEKTMPDLHFRISKERLQMYINLKNPARAKEQLSRLEETAKASRNDSLNNDLLYTQANYYYTFGMNAQGDAAINRLIGQYKELKSYDKVNECYKTLIGIARKANNAGLVARTYDKYILWTDSVKALTAQDELNVLKRKYDESLATIQEKDDSLSAKQYIIIGLCVLAAILAAVLIFGTIVLLRFIVLTRKQKKTISIANEHNELKTKFIQNISAQMEPTLDTLDASLPGVKALHTFSNHIQELSELESTLSEPYEMQEKNISTFCESIMDKIKGKTQEDVTLAVNAPKLNVKINPEQLERILLHLLENAAQYTPAGGKIWLDFKKRGARTHQFIVSDTGCGIPEEQHENIFKPFTEVKDLTQGDGLGLPICSLIATKMNGSLTLDSGYSKGARFILELHA
ncbi:HAMP domain-containing sensor histidine kinase [Bacteroides muris (ex Afrizal et al. 2022)]|jgi:signal transduction histidine kinase|uniref:histidine kinase n=1 Tax=Bacteroides muris (ex Afrizal et al. 2022) TaxID=2516960 RepID=A0A4S2B576_9BACE|nr:HAMP domain-containing sensor histidine kinase [Bacteroides muris (ex Afrizal et al. 2022)]TGY09317.1 HAMP domain-containing histidine kinase [Bacteroides muris (ex Afrizal et al. 2022)]